MRLTQLALDFRLKDDATFAGYCKINNEIAYLGIREMSAGNGEQFTYLWGTAGVGKTHLLQAACHLASEKGFSTVYLPLESIITTHDINILHGLENVDLVCLDNIQVVAKQAIWEEGLFHLFNNIKHKQRKLLIAADQPPNQLNLHLPDLKSRLAWGVIYQLYDLTDQDKLAVLQVQAETRGLILNDVVAKYLLSHYSRDMTYLSRALEYLDQASLAKQRKLTIPFVKQVLDI